MTLWITNILVSLLVVDCQRGCRQCLNSGSSVATSNGCMCQCPSAFTGDICQFDTRSADKKPVTAVSTVTGFEDPYGKQLSYWGNQLCTTEADLITLDLETVHVINEITIYTEDAEDNSMEVSVTLRGAMETRCPHTDSFSYFCGRDTKTRYVIAKVRSPKTKVCEILVEGYIYQTTKQEALFNSVSSARGKGSPIFITWTDSRIHCAVLCMTDPRCNCLTWEDQSCRLYDKQPTGNSFSIVKINVA